MIPLLLFIALGLFILVAFELRARKKSGEIEKNNRPTCLIRMVSAADNI